MVIESTNDVVTGDLVVNLRITRGDYIRASRFDAFDHALLRECESSGSVADKLLGLECIARHVETGASHA